MVLLRYKKVVYNDYEFVTLFSGHIQRCEHHENPMKHLVYPFHGYFYEVDISWNNNIILV